VDGADATGGRGGASRRRHDRRAPAFPFRRQQKRKGEGDDADVGMTQGVAHLAAAAARRAVGGRRAVAGWAVVGSKWSGAESEVGGPSGTVRLVNFPAPLCVLKFKFELTLKLPK
jgi:hypothetical protein